MRVGAIENSEVAPVAMILTPQPFNVLSHNHSFFPVAESGFQLQFLTMFILREDILRYLSFITSDQRVRRLNNQLRRTIVLLQFEEFSTLIQLLEIQDVVNVCPTEGVDTLSIITHDTHLLALFSQLIDNSLLCKVRILILIDEHELELLNIFLADILMILKQYPCLNKQIVEVHRICLTASLHIPYIYISNLRTFLGGIITTPCAIGIGLRHHQVVLGHRDSVGNG